MALTGFNPDEVATSINSVKSAYEGLINALGNEMQSQFVEGMSDKWACNDAQEFFRDSFKPTIDRLISESNRIFESVVSAMNSAAQAWAVDTKTSYSPQGFSPIQKTIDISSIRENMSGIRGVDLALASAVYSKLDTIAENAKNAVSNAQQAVQNCGFIGGNQSSNLVNSLSRIKSNIDSATEQTVTQTKLAIEATIEQYSNTEGRISRAFSGGNE